MAANPTHEVYNQVPEYEGYNLYETDQALKAAIKAEGAERAGSQLSEFGRELATSDSFHLGHLANKHRPELHTYDPRGFRTDQVEFHPAYHHFMAVSKQAHIHCGAFDHLAEEGRDARPGNGVVRAAGHYMVGQVEAGHVCPITMTHAAIPALMVQPDIAQTWLPKILSPVYDPAFRPWWEKDGVTLGMGMTEKQGGTDVRANSTRAEPVGARGGGAVYEITGHKWFMSAPMCDAFLILAQAEGGLSVFLMPRFKADGSVNSLHFQRLKNKMGNLSNASSEVEFIRAHAYLLGEEGRGIANIMTMANYTRLDCALGSAGQMRQALHRAWHHTSHRRVFQKTLIDQPMMSTLIADLAVESQACTHLALHLAGAYDRAGRKDKASEHYARIFTPITKYWVTKRAPEFCYEAMECLGGNGYVEDGIMARIYRDVPVNSIWEGTGNVMALDLIRTMHREADAFELVLQGLSAVRGQHPVYDRSLEVLFDRLSARPEPMEGRWFMEQLAVLESARLLMERAPEIIADAYINTRLDAGNKGGTYGILPRNIRPAEIISAAFG